MTESYKPARTLDQLRQVAGSGDASQIAPQALVRQGEELRKYNMAID